MNYEQFTQEEMDDVIAEAMRHREIEHFHYELNRSNYEAMLKTLPKGDPNGTHVERLQAEHYQHVSSLLVTEEVARDREDHVHAALASKLKHPARKADAFARVKAKIEAQKAAVVSADVKG